MFCFGKRLSLFKWHIHFTFNEIDVPTVDTGVMVTRSPIAVELHTFDIEASGGCDWELEFRFWPFQLFIGKDA